MQIQAPIPATVHLPINGGLTLKEKVLCTGTIIRGVGGNYVVSCDGDSIKCRASGKLRLDKNPPVVGDRVEVEITGNTGYILKKLPQRNLLIRPAIANIDQLVIFASEAPPVTDPYLIDKVSVIALYKDIQPLIVLSKADLSPSSGLRQAYEAAGFPVIEISSVTGQGVDVLRQALQGKISAFTGNSGIGKSSVLNRLNDSLDLEVNEISEKIGRGRHTTRQVQLIQLDADTFVADTPGFSTFEITKMERIAKETLAQYFPELQPYLGQCRFADCTHRAEPDCVVRQAVAAGEIPASRYESYQKLYEELSSLKSWEK